jgi:NAD(P)-dependent dehydrogenase (short-subunit alcohol dehydrogenase family)
MKRNVLITGAAGNLGQAVVDKLKGENHNILAVVSPGKSASISDTKIKVYEADLTRENDVAILTEKIIYEYKTIDAVILLAGGYTYGGVQDADMTTIKKMIAMNFETAYTVVRPVFQQMVKQNGGRIILVGARPAIDPKFGKQSLAYALSKSLIFTLANLLNAEGAEKKVITSVIVPSTIDTPANRQSMPKADFSKWVSAESIADNIAFLVSENADALREPVLKLYGQA